MSRAHKETKLVASFLVGKRSADNARRLMKDLAARLIMPTAAQADLHGYVKITQISTDGFAAYPEAVDLAFGPYAKYGQIIKDYRNADQPGRTQVNLLATRKEEHSRKPQEAYRIIESCSPGPYLELFARERVEGWVQWGDQVDSYEAPNIPMYNGHTKRLDRSTLAPGQPKGADNRRPLLH